MKTQMNLTVRSWQRPLPMKSAEESDGHHEKLRDVIEKTLMFLPEKERKDTVKKNVSAGLSGAAH